METNFFELLYKILTTYWIACYIVTYFLFKLSGIEQVKNVKIETKFYLFCMGFYLLPKIILKLYIALVKRIYEKIFTK